MCLHNMNSLHLHEVWQNLCDFPKFIIWMMMYQIAPLCAPTYIKFIAI